MATNAAAKPARIEPRTRMRIGSPPFVLPTAESEGRRVQRRQDGAYAAMGRMSSPITRRKGQSQRVARAIYDLLAQLGMARPEPDDEPRSSLPCAEADLAPGGPRHSTPEPETPGAGYGRPAPPVRRRRPSARRAGGGPAVAAPRIRREIGRRRRKRGTHRGPHGDDIDRTPRTPRSLFAGVPVGSGVAMGRVGIGPSLQTATFGRGRGPPAGRRDG